MKWLAGVSERAFQWSVRHKWEWRALFAVFYGSMLWLHASADDFGYWNLVNVVIVGSCAGALAWLWWRQDTLDEFARRTRSAIGSDANLMILTARLQLRIATVWRLNRLMRRYDIMGTPALDLPPEAKELREILESQVQH